MDIVLRIGNWVFEYPEQVFLFFLIATGLIAGIGARNSWVGASLAIAAYASWEGVHGNLPVASGLFACALGLALCEQGRFDIKNASVEPSVWLINITLIATVCGVLLRTLHLDVITNIFEGELAPYMAAASSIQGSFIANKGIDGPWAPLGILYYLPMYLCYALFDVSLWSARFSSAVVGIFTIVVLFIVCRRIWSLTTALFAVTFFSLNYLHIGWSRTDVHPHGVTAWPCFLIALATFLFFEKKSFCIRRSLFLVFTMALCWHQYPSGQAAVALPFITAVILFFTQSLGIKQLRYTIPVLLSGALLWYMGLPFSYWLADGQWLFPNPFTLTTQRTSWGNTAEQMSFVEKTWFVISVCSKYFVAFLHGLVNKALYTHHQDYIAIVNQLGWRTYTLVLLPFTLLGFGRTLRNIKDIQYAVLLAMFVAALAPGILSESPVPKRMSVVFPTLDIFSAIGAAYLFTLLTVTNRNISSFLMKLVATIGLITGICFLWTGFFSGRQYPIGQPIEIAHAQKISSKLQPDTLVIYEAPKDYDLGKMIFLLLEDLSAPQNQPIFASFPYSHAQTIAYAQDPSLAINKTLQPPRHWVYNWTKLRDKVDQVSLQHPWKRILFLLQHRTDQETMDDFIAHIAHVQRQCTNIKGKLESTIWLETERSFQNKTVMVTCDLS